MDDLKSQFEFAFDVINMHARNSNNLTYCWFTSCGSAGCFVTSNGLILMYQAVVIENQHYDSPTNPQMLHVAQQIL